MGSSVLLVGVLHFFANIGFQRADLGGDLLLLLPRALDFPLVAIEDGQRDVKGKAELVALFEVALLSLVFGTDGVVHCALRNLQPQLGG